MRICLALCFGLFASSAHAVDYCVGNVVELKQALLAAQSDGSFSVIKVRQGSYVLSESLSFSNPDGLGDGSLTLRGGYIGGACAIQTPSAVGTTLAGVDTLALSLSNRQSLTVEHLSFLGIDVNLNGCALGLSNCTLSVERIRATSARVTLNLDGGTGMLRDSLFTAGRNGLALIVNPYEAPDDFPFPSTEPMRLINVSVVDALTRFGGGDLNDPEDRKLDIRNSSFSRSGAVEIESNRDIQLRFSRYDNLDRTDGAGLLTTNNTTQQPNFNAQFIPNPGSPLIDRGSASVEGGLSRDVYNEPRVVSQAVDIGAAESPVDGTGIFVVDTNAASGIGSLAAAVAFANADDGPNLIRFNIPGSCPKRIARASELVITDGLTIDGYSQPGSLPNSNATLNNAQPCIILDGSNRTHDGIVAGPELSSKNEGLRIRGLAFEDFQDAIELDEGISHAIQGNQFGGTIGNLSGAEAMLAGNERAIVLARNAPQFSLIGGSQLDDRNLIVGADGSAVFISSDNNTVSHNQIGYDRLGVGANAYRNQIGVQMTGADNLVMGNLFGNQSLDAVRINGAGAAGNRVADNTFGGFSITAPPVNVIYGVHLFGDAHDNIVGPNNVFIGNYSAVRMAESSGGRNRITRNAMAEQITLGIDLANIGVSANDNDPLVCNQTLGCPSNGAQNYPIVSSARLPTITPAGRPILVSGRLRTLIRTAPYEIEFFVSDQCDRSGFGEGARFLDRIEVTVENAGSCQASNCTESFTDVFIAADGIEPNQYLTATATSPSGDTSEFSACQRILAGDVISTDGFD